MTAPSPGGVQRWRCYYQSWDNYKHAAFEEPDPDGDWVRYGDIAGMEKELEDARVEIGDRVAQLDGARLRGDFCAADRDEARKEVARLRKVLEDAQRLLIAGHANVASHDSWQRQCLVSVSEALRGAAGEGSQ